MSQEQLNLLITAKNMLSPVLKTVQGDLIDLKKSTVEMSKNGLEAMGNGFQKVADIVKTGFVVGMTAAATGAVLATGASIKFNEQMANIASLMPNSTARVQELKKSVQDMAIELGVSTDDLSAGLYQVVSAFGDTADSAKILGINAMSAKAGLATTTDAINLTSAVTKAYGDVSAGAVQKASDLALMTVRLGQTTFPELAASVGRVTPLMKQLGGSQEELFAVMATMTGVTGGASEVSTQLAGSLQALMAPSKATATLMKSLGFANGEAMIKSLGLQGSIAKLVDEAKKTNTPLQDFIGSIEGQVLALGLAGPQAEDYKSKLEQMKNAAGATNAAFKEQTQGINSFGFTLAQIKSTVQVLSQELGDKLSAKLAPLAQKFSEFLMNINVDEIVSKLEIFGSTIFSALSLAFNFILLNGPQIIIVLATITGGFAGLALAMVYFTLVNAGANLGVVGLIPSLWALASAGWAAVAPFIPFVIAGMAVIAVIAILIIYWNQVYASMQPFLDIAIQIWNFMLAMLVPALAQMGGSLMNLWNVIAPIIIPILKFMAGVIAGVLFSAIIVIIGAITAFANAISSLANTASDRINWIKSVFQSLSQISLYSIGVNIMQGLINGLASMAQYLINSVTSPINSAIDQAKELLGIHSPSRVFMDIGVNTVLGMVKGIDKTLPQLETSGAQIAQVPQDQSQSQSLNLGPQSSGQDQGWGVKIENLIIKIEGNADKSITDQIREMAPAIVREIGPLLQQKYKLDNA
jgi:TP901 family phage tail tape measure protein